MLTACRFMKPARTQGSGTRTRTREKMEFEEAVNGYENEYGYGMGQRAISS